MKCCPTCGQTLPDISDVSEARLRRGEKALYEAVRSAGPNGIHADRLFARLYGNRADGGPETGKQTMLVRINQINTKLRRVGARIVSGGEYGDTFYKLMKVTRTNRRGERTLTAKDVAGIRDAYLIKKKKQVEIARQYGVSQPHVSLILRYGDRRHAPYWKSSK